VRATSIPNAANCAAEVQTFCPLTIQSSPSRIARVDSEARSEPDPGSLNSWHQISSAVMIFCRYRSFCSFVPCSMMVGPASPTPRMLKLAVGSW
jgi:hypothetical protein